MEGSILQLASFGPEHRRLPGIKKTLGHRPDHLFYSSKLSKWLDEEHLVEKGSRNELETPIQAAA